MISLLKFVFILVEQSVQNFLCRLFYQWIHSLAEPTTSPAKYSGLHFAHKPPVLLRICFQSFYLYYPPKGSLKNIFNLYPTSFFCLLHFIFFSVFVLTSPRKTNYLSTYIGKFQSLCGGVLQKFLLPHYNWKVTRCLLGYFTKILQKNCRENFPDNRI